MLGSAPPGLSRRGGMRFTTERNQDMTTLRTSIATASLLVLAGMAQAQQAPDASKPNPSAATSTGTSTSQSEMNRGVPGVNVDVGRNASNGVVGADVDRKTDSRNLTDRNSTGTSDMNTSTGRARAPRADRG
jgi:hypothetical protein